MPISPESIHKPLSDFFLSKFSTPAGAPVFFRFDKFGSVVSDDDFINPEHPEWGYVPAIAQEKFSDLVNRVPIDLNDGVNIILSGDHTIESLYFYQMLNPSFAYVPPGSSDAVAASIIAAFGRVKDDAMKLWEQVRLEKIKLMLDYMPAVPTPAAWYDSHKNDVWTQYSLNITGVDRPGTGAADLSPEVERRRDDDAARGSPGNEGASGEHAGARSHEGVGAAGDDDGLTGVGRVAENTCGAADRRETGGSAIRSCRWASRQQRCVACAIRDAGPHAQGDGQAHGGAVRR